jgi:AbiV family abortive infection protein
MKKRGEGMHQNKVDIVGLFKLHFREKAPLFLKIPIEDQLNDHAVKLTISNAKELLDDAKILLARGSVKSAVGLATLSFEESGKATFVRWGKFGLTHRSLMKEMNHHQSKQRVFQSYLFARNIIKCLMEGSIDTTQKGYLLKILIVAALEDDGSVIKEGIMNLGNVCNNSKESAFYIDIDENYNAIQGEYAPTFRDHVMTRAEKGLEMAQAPNEVHIIASFAEELGRHLKQKRVWKNSAEMNSDMEKIASLSKLFEIEE